jgi:hypothetical protein
MPRTTIDIDASVLRELKRRGRAEGKSLGQLVSELVAMALAQTPPDQSVPPFVWVSRNMGARVDLEDKEALSALLDVPDSHE